LAGFGKSVISGDFSADYPTVQGLMAFFATIVVFASILIDLIMLTLILASVINQGEGIMNYEL